MKNVILSPHFDDAIGSCGGYINRLVNENKRVLIITCFAKPVTEPFSDFAIELHKMWNLKFPVEERTIENQNACNELNVDSLNLQFVEAIYRANNDGFLYPMPNDIFKDIKKEDFSLIGDIFDSLIKVIDKNDNIYAPTAIGFHVDHLLINMVAKKLKANGYKVKYYRDFSYEGKVQTIDDYKITVIHLSDSELNNKINAVKMYKSQLTMLFKGKIEEYYIKTLERNEEYYE